MYYPRNANGAFLPGYPDHDAVDRHASVLELVEAHHKAGQRGVSAGNVAIAAVPRNVGF